MQIKKINKTYHISINTQLTTTVTNQSSTCLCFFDWGKLPKSRWRCKFYGATGAVGFTSNQAIQVYADFGQQCTEMIRNAYREYNAILKQNQIYCGTMIPTNRGSAAVFNSSANDNGEFYLDATPTNNLFYVYQYNHGIGQGLFNPNIGSCLYNFSFEQLDDPIYRTVRNSYNIVFNSDYGTKNEPTTNSLGDRSYYFDWSLIPKGEYEVLTSMTTCDDLTTITGTITPGVNYSAFGIYADFGQNNTTVFSPSSSSNKNVPNNNFLSLVLIETPGGIGPLTTYRDTTPPIFLNQRPTNNNVNIKILSSYSGQYSYSRPLTTVMNYTLCFSFRWLGDRNED